MQNSYPEWFDEYLFDEKEYRDDDIIIFDCYDEEAYLTYEDHLSYSSRAWEQINKQYELAKKYFGFEKNERTSNRYKYHCMYADIVGLPEYMELTTEKAKDKMYRHTLKINNARRFIKSYNCMLREYLFWCMKNHKSCSNHFFLKDDVHYSLFDTERMKEEAKRKRKLHLEQERKKYIAEAKALKEKLEELYKEGKFKPLVTRMCKVLDDTDYLYFDTGVEGVDCSGLSYYAFFPSGQLHYGGNHYYDKLYFIPYTSVYTEDMLKSMYRAVIKACLKALKEHKMPCPKGNIKWDLMESGRIFRGNVEYDPVSEDVVITMYEKR